MDSIKNNNSTPVITKDSKKKIRVDYEGKMNIYERLKEKFKASNTWIKFCVAVMRFVLMLGVSFVILYPFVARIAGSFMTKEDVIDATVSLIPKHPTLAIYKAIIVENHYFDALLNTLLLALGCALVQMLISCLVGYGLAKFRFKGNKMVMALVVITMVIPHGALQLSILKHFTAFDLATVQSWGYPGIIELINGSPLELSNTFAPMFILSVFGLAFKNGLYIYLLRQFFKGVPDELEESAYVDGSGTFRTFFQIILPLSIPMMITVFLFAFSWQWTDEFYTGLFFQSTINKVYLMPDVYQVPASLNVNYAGTALYKNVVQNTGGLMIIAPLIIVYLFGQKYLVQGIERSGLVG
jgi:multiple sugar transport system permease protein